MVHETAGESFEDHGDCYNFVGADADGVLPAGLIVIDTIGMEWIAHVRVGDNHMRAGHWVRDEQTGTGHRRHDREVRCATARIRHDVRVSRQQLEIDEVEMNSVSINREVDEVPDLGFIGLRVKVDRRSEKHRPIQKSMSRTVIGEGNCEVFLAGICVVEIDQLVEEQKPILKIAAFRFFVQGKPTMGMAF